MDLFKCRMPRIVIENITDEEERKRFSPSDFKRISDWLLLCSRAARNIFEFKTPDWAVHLFPDPIQRLNTRKDFIILLGIQSYDRILYVNGGLSKEFTLRIFPFQIFGQLRVT